MRRVGLWLWARAFIVVPTGGRAGGFGMAILNLFSGLWGGAVPCSWCLVLGPEPTEQCGQCPAQTGYFVSEKSQPQGATRVRSRSGDPGKSLLGVHKPRLP